MLVTNILLDTPAWVSSFARLNSLSKPAIDAISNADRVYVSPISVLDVSHKVRFGNWPELLPIVHRLADIPEEQGAMTANFTPEIFRHASQPQWAHIDPYDRLIAATAEFHDMLLVTKRAVFAELPNLRRIWQRSGRTMICSDDPPPHRFWWSRERLMPAVICKAHTEV